MDTLLFAIQATIPIFLTMLLGVWFRHIGLFSEDFVKKLNHFVFTAALPILLFEDIATTEIKEVWDTKFVLFCFLITAACILISYLISLRFSTLSQRGEFIQASYRSSAAILGIAFMQNIYGNAGMAPLMIVASVPLYNIMAVLVLSLIKPESDHLNRQLLKQTLLDILRNPILLGIMFGILWSFSGLKQPIIMEKTLHNLEVLATPLGLMAMGGSFRMKAVLQEIKPALIASFLKLVGFVCLFLPFAILLGFRDEKLIAILVMLGSATTVSCFVMAKNMGHEGVLSSAVVMMTTLGSAFTLTLWLFLLKYFLFI